MFEVFLWLRVSSFGFNRERYFQMKNIKIYLTFNFLFKHIKPIDLFWVCWEIEWGIWDGDFEKLEVWVVNCCELWRWCTTHTHSPSIWTYSEIQTNTGHKESSMMNCLYEFRMFWQSDLCLEMFEIDKYTFGYLAMFVLLLVLVLSSYLFKVDIYRKLKKICDSRIHISIWFINNGNLFPFSCLVCLNCLDRKSFFLCDVDPLIHSKILNNRWKPIDEREWESQSAIELYFLLRSYLAKDLEGSSTFEFWHLYL